MITFLFFIQGCKTTQDDNANVAQAKQKAQAAGYNVQLGLAYLKQGDISRSKLKFLTALKQNPKSPEVNTAMGYFMEKTGDIEKAKSYYEKSISLAPSRGAGLNNYGAFLCRQGKYVLAERYFLKAVNDVQYEHTAAAYENAGLCAEATPDETKAMQFFAKALQQDPSRQVSLYELAKLTIKKGQYDEALSLLNKYQDQVNQSPDLLALAKTAAHQAGKLEKQS